MNPIGAIQRWRDSRRQRAELRSIAMGGGWVPAAPILSGTYVTPETSLSLAAVYAAVNVISRDLASLPGNVYRKLPGGGREIAEEMPQHELIHTSPDGERDACRFFAASMGHVLTQGNSYTEIERDKRDGTPVALHLLHPRKTLAKRTPTGALYYELDGDPDKRLAPENVLHFAGLGFNGLSGYSPVTVCRQTLGLGLAVEQFGASFFGNGAIPRGFLKLAKKLSATAVDNLRRSFNAIHQGSQSAHQLGVLEEGMDWMNTQVSPEDGQFIATRQFQVIDIARIFSIPPHKIGDYSQAHLSSVEEANLDYIATTLLGWVVMLEAQLNAKLLTREDRKQYEIALDMSALLRGNTAARLSWSQGMRNMGAANADEIRHREGLNPIGKDRGGNLYLVQGQYIPLEQVGKQPEIKPPPAKGEQPRSQRYNKKHGADGKFGSGSGGGPGGGGSANESTSVPEKSHGEAAKAAKVEAKKTGKAEQRYGEAQEAKLVERFGGAVEGKDSEPIDVRRRIGDKTHGIEVKTIVNQGGNYSGGKAQLSMKADQIERKLAWRNAKPGREVHTIAIDHRDRAKNLDTGEFIGNKAAHSGHDIYYKRGIGKLRIGAMHKVSSMAELKKLVSMPYDELPRAAQGKIR